MIQCARHGGYTGIQILTRLLVALHSAFSRRIAKGIHRIYYRTLRSLSLGLAQETAEHVCRCGPITPATATQSTSARTDEALPDLLSDPSFDAVKKGEIKLGEMLPQNLKRQHT